MGRKGVRSAAQGARTGSAVPREQITNDETQKHTERDSPAAEENFAGLANLCKEG
jgi:hypothetical protein